jgi:hypothetical protein
MSSVIKSSFFASLSVLALSAPAWAQVTAELPYPHAVTCADFHHHRSNDTWSPKGEVQITSSSGTVSLSPGSTVAAGQVVGGYDLGKWLDSTCRKSKEW